MQAGGFSSGLNILMKGTSQSVCMAIIQMLYCIAAVQAAVDVKDQSNVFSYLSGFVSQGQEVIN